jgi:hypothetical protein
MTKGLSDEETKRFRIIEGFFQILKIAQWRNGRAVVPIVIGGGGLSQKWRNGRAVECGGLENRCPVSTGPGVRIPLSPPNASDQSRSLLRDFCFIKSPNHRK